MNRRDRKKNPLVIFFDVMITVLCVNTVGAGVFAVQSLHETYNYNYDVESFYYRLDDEDYGTMVKMYYENEASGVKADEELKQYYGIARYFEAATYCKMYEEAGKAEKVAKYEKQLEEAKNEMGELEFVADQIDEKLDSQQTDDSI